MAKSRGGQRSGGQKASRRSGGHGAGPWLVGLILVLLAVPTAAAIIVWQSHLGGPDFRLPWPAAAAGAPTASPLAGQKSPAKAAVPTAPLQQQATAAPPTKPPLAAAPTATVRPVASPASATPAAKLVLRVPIYKQQHDLSCEAAALRMALATFGTQMSEDGILAAMPRDTTSRKVVGDTVVWGDPDVGFVGKWDGTFLQDGYGVYEAPIADLAMSYGFQATRHGKNVDPKQLYASLRDGMPSIVWMPYGLTVKGRGSWQTPAGKKVPYVVTEHAVALAGIDERGVYYADPQKPDLQFATFTDFEKAIAELDGRYVTVRP